MLIHTGDNTHECYVCKKAFTQSGIKCEKAYVDAHWASGLRQHMVTHTVVKQHECKVCKETFTLPSNLKKHMLLHSSNKPQE